MISLYKLVSLAYIPIHFKHSHLIATDKALPLQTSVNLVRRRLFRENLKQLALAKIAKGGRRAVLYYVDVK